MIILLIDKMTIKCDKCINDYVNLNDCVLLCKVGNVSSSIGYMLNCVPVRLENFKLN